MMLKSSDHTIPDPSAEKVRLHILYFIGAWLVLNLLQAYYTEISDDEAYYWMYSRYLDWGYFDHPPMIALLIRMGYSIFHNELGVRIFPLIMGAGTLYMIYLLAGKPSNLRLFAFMVLSVVLVHLHLAGFLAIPDMPMLFFTALFFLVFREYEQEDRLKWALLVVMSIDGMLYSKYHGILVVFFTVLANTRLFRRRSFWLIFLLSVVLYLPHILWQADHDYISLRYHLIGRNDPQILKQFYDYLLNQVVVTGPLTGVILLYLSFGRRTKNSFERTLKFNLVGFFGFFLLSSLKDHVEPHWTAAAFIPMFVLAWPGLTERKGLQRWFSILALVSIPLILAGRLYLVTDYLPVSGHISHMFHGQKKWAEQVAALAHGRPVVFTNKYQQPSVYRFYTGGFAHTRTDIDYRKNQYDLWDFEDRLIGKEVVYFLTRNYPGEDTLKTVHGDYRFVIMNHYCSFNRIRIRILNGNLDFGPGMEVPIRLELTNTGTTDAEFDGCLYPPELFWINYWGKADYEDNVYRVNNFELPELKADSSRIVEVSIHTPDSAWTSEITFGIGDKYLLPGTNCRYRKMTIRTGHDH